MDKHYLNKDLYIDYCSQKASEYSVYKWHYSKRMPKSKLVRVALAQHKNPVSKIVSFTLKKLKKAYPKLKAVVSYADPERDHKGKIYQAMNWYYIGETSKAKVYIINDKEVHSKTISDRIRFNKLDKNHNLDYKITKGKYKYVYLFDKKLFNLIRDKIQKYPA